MNNDAAQLDALRARRPADKPLIGITMGDPGGIGAEVIVKALADPAIRALGRFIIYGMQEPLEIAADLVELDACWFRRPHEDVSEVASGVALADYDEFSCGVGLRRPSAEAGQASLRFVEDAVRAAGEGRLNAVVTGPIHKISWKLAGCRFPGHTELLCELCNAKRVTMMFVGGPFRIALASTHVGLFDLRAQFSLGLVFHPIDQLDDALRRWWGMERPRIAVAALNPHAGEGGMFGDEETRVIEPAIAIARDHGIDVTGPFPADTLFRNALNGRFDGIVAMYHDQALIPVKLLAFDEAVNVTLGLPIIRTSVDHGTAFDIAGKNKANAGSMKAAIQCAALLASQPRRESGRISADHPPAAVTAPQSD
ncbi:MAG: 4-hydroxythreonine-4-phosphate dehydrogenase PdxA [Phycisphaerales bacterium]|nr:4-hydroxythreonine-4-phosphate dehydrogenase PdxA [Phycisphaerales bacterium]